MARKLKQKSFEIVSRLRKKRHNVMKNCHNVSRKCDAMTF